MKNSKAPAYLVYVATTRRDLLDGAAQHGREIEEARRQLKRIQKKAVQLDQFVARKRGSKRIER